MASQQMISRRRMLWLMLIVGLLFLVLIVRLVDLMVIRSEQLQKKASAQWTSNTTVSAERGRILDRNGNVLAQNASSVWITAAPVNIKDPAAAASSLSDLLGVDRDTLITRLSNKNRASVSVARHVPADLAAKVRALGITGVYFSEDTTRIYTHNNMLSQLIGFVNVDGDGQTGLELLYNDYLSGEDGYILTQRDGKGRTLLEKSSEYVQPVDGYDVELTVDYVIQSYAEGVARSCLEANGAKGVTVLVMDVNTGALLSSVVLPDFDLNAPPRDDLSLLNSLSRNKIVTDTYEPGSTFKIFTTAAALDSGSVTPDSTFHCSGSIMLGSDRIKCWRYYNPHGAQNLTEAVMNSCNPVFVQLALRMGRTLFYDYLRAFGIGARTGVDISGEVSGSLIAEKYVTESDLARIGFGQSVSVTPLQLITSACAVVNGGTLYEPYVVARMLDGDGAAVYEASPTAVGRPISAETSAVMCQMLEKVVSEGSGRNAYRAGYRIGGKTGTAQKYDQDGRISTSTHIASFLGFAPMDDPQVAVLVIVDEPSVQPDYGSITAAPYAGELLEMILQYLNIAPVYSQDDAMYKDVVVRVPDMTGKSVAGAVSELNGKGFLSLTVGEGSSVTGQLPAEGSAMDYGGLIILYCEGAEEQPDGLVEVPDLSGMGVVEAARQLEALGLNMRVDGNGGVAVSQSEKAGTRVAPGTCVTVKFQKQ